MKRLFCFLAVLSWGIAAMAQTPLEIVARMEEAMSQHEKDGLAMTVDTKIPIIGAVSVKTASLGDKIRVETSMKGVKVIEWEDGKTEWTYNSKNNTVEIKNAPASASGGNEDTELFTGIADGYDVTIQKETAEEWHLLCAKSKTNTDKDAPRSLNLVVAKGTYLPVSLSTKISGVSMSMHDIAFGVSESQVVFDAGKFPDATLVDKR